MRSGAPSWMAASGTPSVTGFRVTEGASPVFGFRRRHRSRREVLPWEENDQPGIETNQDGTWPARRWAREVASDADEEAQQSGSPRAGRSNSRAFLLQSDLRCPDHFFWSRGRDFLDRRARFVVSEFSYALGIVACGGFS